MVEPGLPSSRRSSSMKLDAFEHHRQLMDINLDMRLRPVVLAQAGEGASLEALVDDRESTSCPHQQLGHRPSSIKEDEDVPR